METLLTLTLSGSILALLLMALRYLILKKMPSTVYYYAWLLVLLRFILPLPGLLPMVSDYVNHFSAAVPVNHTVAVDDDMVYPPPALQQTAPVYKTAESNSEKGTPEGTKTEPAATSKLPFDWRISILWLKVWVVGSVVCFGVTVFSYLRFMNTLKCNLLMPEPFVLAVYHSLPGSKPALYCCRAFKTPLMCGIIHPKIVLPTDQLEEELLTNILRHELMHYRRRDTLYKWLAVFVISLHWFNPVAWLAGKEISRACELSCDEMLLRTMNRAEKQSYGNTLLKIAASSSLPAGVVATTFSTEKKNLKERLEQIMNYKKSRARMLAAVLALVLLVGCGMAAGPRIRNAAAADSSPEVAENAVRVTTVDELLAAIAPNTVIELSAGEYDLSTASNYGTDTHSSYYSWNGIYSNDEVAAELVIHNIDGLTLRGAGKGETVIAAVPRYANVIKFIGCNNLTVSNLTAGHTTEPGWCMGGVLRLESCTDVSIDACGLFGCGTIGVHALDCSRLKVMDSEIYECSYGAVDCGRCWDVSVSGCDIHHHGSREGQEEAMNLFSVSYSEGFTVYNCRVHDNRAQYLLNSSYTKNVLFLSNEVKSNVFGAKVFTFQQYGATVDGCRFEGNDMHGWYTGNGIFAADTDGNALEGAVLGEMVLRDIPPESVAPKPAALAQTTEVPVGGQILVKTVDEFLACLGPDRTIILDGEFFDLSAASNYGGIGTQYYFWKENPDGPGLVIHDVSGLTIQAKNTASGATTLAAIPRFADVLSFQNCENLFLGGFTAGHTKEPGVCSGGVLSFQNCNQVMIEKMRLYGCGVLGIQASNCATMAILRTEIYECSQGAVQFFQTDGINFQDCDVHDVPSPALSFTECGDKTWNGQPLSDLNSRYDVDTHGNLIVYETLVREEESEFHGGVEEVENPFAMEPTLTFVANTPQAAFTSSVQRTIVNDDWEALADKIFFPLQFFTDHYSFVIHDREEYLKMTQEGYFTNELFTDTFRFRERIANASLAEYGSCIFGNTCLDHLIAFTCTGNKLTEDNLKIRAISVLTPFWPGRDSSDEIAFEAQPYILVTPQP